MSNRYSKDVVEHLFMTKGKMVAIAYLMKQGLMSVQAENTVTDIEKLIQLRTQLQSRGQQT